MKKYKHIPTGAIVTQCSHNAAIYENEFGGQIQSYFFKGQDWEEIIEYPIGTKVSDAISPFKGQINLHFADGRYLGMNIVNKVKPKEWEITGFRNITSKEIFPLLDKEFYGRSKENGMTKQLALLNKAFIEIYSVRRLSDNVEFKIEDKIRLKDKPLRTIEAIINEYNELRFKTCAGHITIKNATKVEKLFTTEDGIDIYKGDKFFFVKIKYTDDNCVDKEWEVCKPKQGYYFRYEPHADKYFSTKEAAQAYIIENKPCLSLNDIENNVPAGYFISRHLAVASLKELIKTRIKTRI